MIGSRRVIVWAFVGATAALLTATHWPGLAVRGPFSRTDLLIHAGVYLVWGLLLAFGPMRSKDSAARGAALWRIAGVGIAFAAFDETTQPLFRRTFDPLDLAADATGILAACAALWCWRRSTDSNTRRRAGQ